MGFSKASQIAAPMQLIVVVVVALLAAGGTRPAEAAAADEAACMPSISSLMPCLPFTEGKGSQPSDACCRNLAQVVQSHPLCLCAVLDGEAGRWLGIPVDVSRALALPPACSVPTPPASRCNSSTSGAPSPSSGGAAPSPPATPSGIRSGAVVFTKYSNILDLVAPIIFLYLAGL